MTLPLRSPDGREQRPRPTTARRSPPASALVVLGALLLEGVLAVQWLGLSTPADPPGKSPSLFLWAWERPEDLSFLKGRSDIGVAFLALTLSVDAGHVRSIPRLQPLLAPDDTTLVAVVRIETKAGHGGSFPGPVDRIVGSILAEADRPGVSAIQIDFDASLSERSFYREILTRLRRRMSPDKRLSMTALASWCAGDPWIGDLPLDEAVPMLFQMGPDSPAIERLLETGHGFPLPICRRYVGLSLDETRFWPLARTRRAYLFKPATGWTEQSVSQAVQRWRNRHR